MKGKTIAKGEISIPKTKVLYMLKTLSKNITLKTLLRQKVQISGRLHRVSPLDCSALGPEWHREGALLGSPIVPMDPSCPRSSNAQSGGGLPSLDWRPRGASFGPSWGAQGHWLRPCISPSMSSAPCSVVSLKM